MFMKFFWFFIGIVVVLVGVEFEFECNCCIRKLIFVCGRVWFRESFSWY